MMLVPALECRVTILGVAEETLSTFLHPLEARLTALLVGTLIDPE
jgi:hypothetical protein